MEKKYLTIFLCLLTFDLFAQNQMSKKYYDDANKIIEKTDYTEWNSDSPEIKRAQELLDKSIESCKDWWNPYIQKIQIYRVPNYDLNIDADYENIIKVYKLWLDNGNSFSDWQKFTYACTLFSVGEKKEANVLYKEIEKNLQSNKKDASSIIAGLFSSIILGDITTSNIDSCIKKYEKNFKEPMKISSLLKDAVETDVEDFIPTYAGAW